MASVSPEYVAVLDPFLPEAKELVRSSPPLDSLSEDIVELSIKRAGWESGREMVVDFSADAVRADVLSFYLLCQGVAAVSHPYSRESRLVTEATRETIRYRMYDLFKRGYTSTCLDTVGRSLKFVELKGDDGLKLGDVAIPKEDCLKLRDRCLVKEGIDISREMIDEYTLPQYLPKYAVRWTDLAPLLKHSRLDLTELYIVNGWAVITPRELWNIFASLIAVRTEEYIASLYERFVDTAAPKLFVGVGERIAALVPAEIALEERALVQVRGRLRPECFPPCIKKIMGGVGAGGRNFAIVMLLTPFLSYARVSPSGRAIARVADFVNDISIVRDEIAPLIFEAAERCNPPLFSDQPQEKANVFYHMGFGMTVEPRIEDSGKSKWYRCLNCDKVRVQAPTLCDPDEMCRRVKNPLTYYYRRLAER